MGKGLFITEPHKNWTCHSKVTTYWKVVKTVENKRTYFLCLSLSPNQYLRVPTHFAWSHHIFRKIFPLLTSPYKNFCRNSQVLTKSLHFWTSDAWASEITVQHLMKKYNSCYLIYLSQGRNIVNWSTGILNIRLFEWISID